MKEFIKALERDTQKKLERIERSEQPTTRKAKEVSRLLAEAFDRLKEFTIGYRFGSPEEEIGFFKETKPRFFCRLVYYRALYNIEMNRPAGSPAEQKEYLTAELKAIDAYTRKRIDFIRYYRSGATHLDAVYFLRGQADLGQYLEPFQYELDPSFTTNADFVVTKICANDLLTTYLLRELEMLERERRPYTPNPFPAVRLTWQDSKGSFGNVSLNELAGYIFNVFNVQPDRNISRTFGDMKIRNRPTPYLDALLTALKMRMQNWRKTKKKKTEN